MTSRLLVIQIPCLNEHDQIGSCLEALPKHIPGFSRIETLVIDDGSDDGTAKAARDAGAHHVLVLGYRQGLAQAFYQGLKYAFTTLRADALVNFDADLQYLPSDITRLVEPIASGQADYVLGERQFDQIEHWSGLKKTLQQLGSFFVSVLCWHDFSDVTTGFRALNREAGLRLSVLTQYTYTVETLVHATHRRLRLLSIPIHIREIPTRRSRLIQSTTQYCFKAVKTALVTLLRHRAAEFFAFLCFLSLIGAVASIGGYFLGESVTGLNNDHMFSFCRLFSILTVNLLIASILADNIYTNRSVVEEIRYEQRLRDIERSAVSSRPSSLEISKV